MPKGHDGQSAFLTIRSITSEYSDHLMGDSQHTSYINPNIVLGYNTIPFHVLISYIKPCWTCGFVQAIYPQKLQVQYSEI